jgi:hypothetical protein
VVINDSECSCREVGFVCGRITLGRVGALDVANIEN